MLLLVAVLGVAGRLAIASSGRRFAVPDLIAVWPTVWPRVRAVAQEDGAWSSGDRRHAEGGRALAVENREGFGQEVSGSVAVVMVETVTEPGDGSAVGVVLAVAAAAAVVALVAAGSFALLGRAPSLTAIRLAGWSRSAAGVWVTAGFVASPTRAAGGSGLPCAIRVASAIFVAAGCGRG